MAEQLPVNFPIPPERGIGNYSFNNIQEGFGLVRYYLYASKDSGGTDYVISNQQPYSAVNQIGINTDTTQTTTFYSPVFNRARTMKGIAYFNFCLQNRNANGDPEGKVQIKLYHYDGTISTQLGSTWESEEYGNETEMFRAVSGSFTLSSQQKFSPGDRIKMEIIQSGDYDGASEQYIGISPVNSKSDQIDPAVDTIFHDGLNEGPTFTTFTLDLPYSLED